MIITEATRCAVSLMAKCSEALMVRVQPTNDVNRHIASANAAKLMVNIGRRLPQITSATEACTGHAVTSATGIVTVVSTAPAFVSSHVTSTYS